MLLCHEHEPKPPCPTQIQARCDTGIRPLCYRAPHGKDQSLGPKRSSIARQEIMERRRARAGSHRDPIARRIRLVVWHRGSELSRDDLLLTRRLTTCAVGSMTGGKCIETHPSNTYGRGKQEAGAGRVTMQV